MALDPELYQRLRETLLRCGPFNDEHQLQAMFLDARLSPWRDHLSRANTTAGTVDGVILLLIEKSHAQYERDALALFLEVLAERIDPDDKCRQQVEELLQFLERSAGSSERAIRRRSASSREPDRTELLQLLTTHFSAQDLRDFCFYLQGVDFDDLPGSGKSTKARELILFMERRMRLGDLIAVGQKVRPDVPWSDAVSA